MIDRVRDHSFRFDRSPRREQQRMQSFERSLSLERSQPSVTLERTHTPRERSPERTRTPARQLGRTLRDLSAALDRGDEVGNGAGLRVKLREDEREHEHDRGMSW